MMVKNACNYFLMFFLSLVTVLPIIVFISISFIMRMSCGPDDMTRLNRNLFLICVILCFSSASASWRPFEIKLYDPTYTVFFPKELDYNATIDENGRLSFYYNFLREFPDPFLHLEYLFDDGNGNFNMVYVNKTISLCSFLANKNVDIILRIAFSVGEKFGVLPKRCPLKKTLYYVANMKITADNLPPFMPEKNGVLNFNLMLKEKGKFMPYVNTKMFFKLERVFKNVQN